MFFTSGVRLKGISLSMIYAGYGMLVRTILGLIASIYFMLKIPMLFEINMKNVSTAEVESSSFSMALIANPFIPPTPSSFGEKVNSPTVLAESLDEISINNIHRVKLLVSRLTMNMNYLPIIDLISKIDLNKLVRKDFLDLNYWFANALLQTGKCSEAKNIIITNLVFAKDDRYHFLLALTYEKLGRTDEAKEEYLKFIKQFPKSDYAMSALIKARMLVRF